MYIVIPVHGTGDNVERKFGAPGQAGSGSDADPGAELAWWCEDSPFAKKIRESYSTTNEELLWEPFRWSGKNSERERDKAARALAERLKRAGKRKEGQRSKIVLIAHSHGGNVVIDALTCLKASMLKEMVEADALKSVFLIGTPILRYRDPAAVRWSTVWSLAGAVLFLPPLAVLGWALAEPALIFLRQTPLYVQYACWTLVGVAALAALTGEIRDQFRLRRRNAAARKLHGEADNDLFDALKSFLTKPLEGVLTKNKKQAAPAQASSGSNSGLPKEIGKSQSLMALRSIEQNQSSQKADADTGQIGAKSAPSGEVEANVDEDKTSSATVGETNEPVADNLNPARSIERWRLGVLLRLVNLRSRYDEAINGLHRAEQLERLPIARPEYLVGVTAVLVAGCTLFCWLLFAALAAETTQASILVLADTVSAWAPEGLRARVAGLSEEMRSGPVRVAALWCFAVWTALVCAYWASVGISAWFNRRTAKFMKRHVFGDDHRARRIAGAQGDLVGLDPEDRWRVFPTDLDSAQRGTVDSAAATAWQRARELLLLADYSGEFDFKAHLENSGVVDWNSLVHTTYFRTERVRDFIAWLVCVACDRQMQTADPDFERFFKEVRPAAWGKG